MISKSELATQTRELLPYYQPNNDTLGVISPVDLTLLLGITGAGKDSARTASGLHVVVSDTTRDERTNNGKLEVSGVEYHFRGNELDKVEEDIEDGIYVQLGVVGDDIYGSRPFAYPRSGAAVLDIVLGQLDTIKALPFGSVRAAYIVPPSFEVWQQRWNARGHVSPEDTARRMKGSKGSLLGALERDDLIFVVNDDLSETGAMVRHIAVDREHNPLEAARAKNVARKLLLDLEAA